MSERADALRFYKTYLKKLPDASNRDEVQRLIVLLEAQLKDEKTVQAVPPTGTIDPAAKTKAVIEPGPSVTVAATTIVAQPSRTTPVYKKWWLWTVVGVAVAGAAVGIGLGVALSKPAKFEPTLPSWGPALTVGF